MPIDDAIVEFGFDCKVRKLSAKTVANYQKQLRYIEKYLKDEFQISEVEEIKPYDEVTMPPELRTAHQDNDKAVMAAYGLPVKGTTESSCVAELMRRYQAMVERE